ncbi:chloride transporter, ClC family [Bifidobacterium gallicum DSM 20093 = LMG 11596]|nr:chloride transporter, ClC family [Bifidobacterium gallicum DSM 20093 = LMG 11596]
MAAAVVLLGALIGACGGLLTLMLYGIEHLALGFVESPELPGPFETDWRRRALSVLIGATVAAVAWFVLRTYARRVPSVRQAVDGESMPWWQTVVHVLLQIGIVGMGLSVGREVAPRELGAMLAQRVARVLHVHDVDLRRLVAISAGAGLAAVYNAPLAGAFFTIEILLVDVSAMTVVLSFLCSALAAWVATLVKGAHVFYLLDGVHAQFSPDLMAFALVAGVVCGVCGALFRRGSSWAESHKSSGASILWTLPAAGLVTGVVAIWVPQVMGNGRATAQLGFTGRPELAFAGLLLISFLAKAIVTLLTIRCGASGGVLTPGIALGASMGCVLGMCWAHITGAQDMSVFALLGAAALLSASQNAPIMAMCLVMELTQAPMTWFVPVAFIAMIAVMTARWFTTHVMDRAHVQEMRV